MSEGTRPRLPLAPRLRAFVEDPRPVLALLELLKADPVLMVRRSVANNLNDIASQGARSLLASEAELKLKGGLFGHLLDPILGPLMQRMAPGALASFKYLVEQGRPYSGKASELPRASARC